MGWRVSRARSRRARGLPTRPSRRGATGGRAGRSALGAWFEGLLFPRGVPRYSRHMKRTNLVLREDLLREAVAVSGEKTYSRAVEVALEDFVRRAKARRILQLRGSGAWSGDLAAMRRDTKPTGRRRS